MFGSDDIRSEDVRPYGTQKPDSAQRKRIREAIRSEIALGWLAEDRLVEKIAKAVRGR